MCKEMLVIPVNRVVDMKIIIRKNGGPWRRRGTRGCFQLTSQYQTRLILHLRKKIFSSHNQHLTYISIFSNVVTPLLRLISMYIFWSIFNYVIPQSLKTNFEFNSSVWQVCEVMRNTSNFYAKLLRL
jgi:hypothetical protein